MDKGKCLVSLCDIKDIRKKTFYTQQKTKYVYFTVFIRFDETFVRKNVEKAESIRYFSQSILSLPTRSILPREAPRRRHTQASTWPPLDDSIQSS